MVWDNGRNITVASFFFSCSVSWIQRAISPSVATNVIWIDTAFEVWEDLRERFSQGDLVRVFEL